MPLEKGKGRKKHSRNVSELMHKYHETGGIGKTRPKSEAHAQEIANAIAYKQGRKK